MKLKWTLYGVETDHETEHAFVGNWELVVSTIPDTEGGYGPDMLYHQCRGYEWQAVVRVEPCGVFETSRVGGFEPTRFLARRKALGAARAYAAQVREGLE